MFELDPRLEADTAFITDLKLSRVVLMNDARFPWLILVPRIVGVRELHALAPSEVNRMTTEFSSVARILESLTGAHKMNVAALGNVVSQLHIHVIARFATDQAWPAPVWGQGTAEPYEPEVMEALVNKVKPALEEANI